MNLDHLRERADFERLANAQASKLKRIEQQKQVLIGIFGIGAGVGNLMLAAWVLSLLSHWHLEPLGAPAISPGTVFAVLSSARALQLSYTSYRPRRGAIVLSQELERVSFKATVWMMTLLVGWVCS